MSGGPLVLAVPSKGRLQENAAAFFARAGLVLSQGRGVREYRGAISGVPDVEVLFLSASEIVSKLAAGGAHLGVTGEDLVREGIADAAERVELLTPLGFGQANVVVCVPQAWIDVRTMADLEEVAADLRARHASKMRVATKYVNLTRRFFAERGVADYRIVESLGATEGAPAAGAAESSSTSRRRGRRFRECPEGARRRRDPALRGEPRRLDRRRMGRARSARPNPVDPNRRRGRGPHDARDPRRMDPDRPLNLQDFARLATLPYGAARGVELVLRCPKERVLAFVEALVAAGARDVTVGAVDYVFRPGNPLPDRLFARLP